MSKKTSISALLALAATAASAAQSAPHQALNICAIAIPVLNQYIVNYEYLYGDHHGLGARLEYAPALTGAGIDARGMAAVLNYR